MLSCLCRSLCVLSILSLVVASACAAEYFVSPDGDDTADGSTDAPFATIARAISAVEGSGGGTINVQSGDYFMREGLKIGAKHSGTAESPLVIRAADGAEVTLVGGKVLTGARAATEQEVADLISAEARTRVVVFDLTDVSDAAFRSPSSSYQIRQGAELFIDGRRMPIARWPNDDYVTIEKVIDAGRDESGKTVRPGQFTLEDRRPAKWKLERGVWLAGYWCHDWSFETLRVETYDATDGSFKMQGVHNYGIGPSKSWNKHPRRFYAENVFEELDRPGEWWLDREGRRLFLYPPSEDLSKSRVMLTTLTDPILTIDGAKHVGVAGLTFDGSMSTGIEVRRCEDVELRNLTVRNMTRSGVRIEGRRCGIVASEIHNVGSSGVGLRGGDRRSLLAGECYAVGCHIHHFSRLQKTYAPAIGLGGVGNRAANCHIHDAPHAAILYGGNEHTIELNDIHHVALETSDVGAIYTGRDWTSRGNVLRWNYIHDLNSMGAVGTSGIYLDDCDSGDRLVGNLFVNIGGRAILVGGGRDNDIVGNVFVNCRYGIHLDDRAAGWAASHFGKGSWDLVGKCKAVDYQNPPWSDRYPRLARILDEDPLLPLGNRIQRNLFVDTPMWLFHGKAKEVVPRLTVKDNLEVTADAAEMIDAENGDYRLKKDSPVWEKIPGFKAIPVEHIGPRESLVP